MKNEKQLISVDDVKKRIVAFATGCHSTVLAIDAIIMMLNQTPTVDAVPVVRCRDCKHRHNGKDCTHPLLLSYSWGAIRNVKDDDFCSYGERKEAI